AVHVEHDDIGAGEERGRGIGGKHGARLRARGRGLRLGRRGLAAGAGAERRRGQGGRQRGPDAGRDHGVLQVWFRRFTSGNTSSGSIVTSTTAGSAGTVTTSRVAPASHASTGTSTRSTRPSARVIASRAGSGLRPTS